MLDVPGFFRAAGCEGSLAVVRLADGELLSCDPDRDWVMASIVKVPIALEFYSQVSDQRIDPSAPVALDPATNTPGPVGISRFQQQATVSLGDLAYLMLTISDNAATDVVTDAVGIEAVNRRLKEVGCSKTVVVGTLREMLADFAADLGFADYSELLDAQSGALGVDAHTRSTDPDVIDRCRALDDSAATRTTARDMTNLLAAIWSDSAGPPLACSNVREVMAEQVTRRLGPAVRHGGAIAAKSGGLFRRVRNEVGVITDPDGSQYAFAVLTRAGSPEAGHNEVVQAMVRAVGAALDELRGRTAS